MEQARIPRAKEMKFEMFFVLPGGLDCVWPWQTIAVSGSEPPVVEMYPFGEGTTVRRGSLTVWSTNFDCDNSPPMAEFEALLFSFLQF